MNDRHDIPKKFRKLFARMRKIHIPYKLTFFIVGIASTLWFLIRVIPKPSRAAYPCMRTAAPFMSSFILYLLSITASSLLLKRSRDFFYRTRYLLGFVALAGALLIFAFSSSIFPETLSAGVNAIKGSVPADFPANQPMGEGHGIHPGRVVWVWDQDATDENCTNEFDHSERGEDGYMLTQNSDQSVVNAMMDDMILRLSGEQNLQTAWQMLFKNFNQERGRGDQAYQDGQQIFIKMNMGTSGWLTDEGLNRKTSPSWTLAHYMDAETSPVMAIALLDQLVNKAGVPQENIWIGDPMAHIFQDVYEQMAAVFPDVKYVDKDGNEDLGRTKINPSDRNVMVFSDKGAVLGAATTDNYYLEMEEADYLVNLATLKAHARNGITLTAKNHFGSHTRDGASHMHPGLVGAENDQPSRTDYGMYRVLTDIMGHELIGGNTLLFLVEGLWGGPEATERPVKWDMVPFSGDWPNSILASQDAVALESVCFDLLRTEFNDPSAPGKDRPWFGAVDDYIQQAASSANWPDGITYDPEGDGTPMPSMGIHEHWNNETDRQYSRNLGSGQGIDLQYIREASIPVYEAAEVPVFDGEGLDQCWTEAVWTDIDQTWINWGESIPAEDFSARFKLSWSQAQNLLYFLVEVTDDVFVDGYVPPDGGYPNFDIVEVFIDEDRSGGLHVFDGSGSTGDQWGTNAENAFSYHLAVNAPADGGTVTEKYAMDIDGTGWSNRSTPDYADHFPDFIMKKSGNSYVYEFSMKVYNDSYDAGNPEASRVALTTDREIGLSMAYCDNDTPGTDRDNFFGSVWVEEEAYNDHWMLANDYGSIRLMSGSGYESVAVIGDIADFTITELDTDLVVHQDLSQVFEAGSALSYTIEESLMHVFFSSDGDELKVHATNSFEGSFPVKVIATDGRTSAELIFQLDARITGISEQNAEGLLRLYPNPSNGLVHLRAHDLLQQAGSWSLEVFDLSGRMLYSERSASHGEMLPAELDLRHLNGGVYLVHLSAGDLLISEQLMID